MSRESSENTRVSRDDSSSSMGPRPLFKRRKTCPFSDKNSPKIDYKDVRMLERYLTERGRIIPSRISFVSSSKQRELANAIKRARHLALLPYEVK